VDTQARVERIHPALWTVALIGVIAAFMWLCSALFAGSLTTTIPVTLTADRSGLVMEPGAKVKLRGVQVGRVARLEHGTNPVRLKLELFPDHIGRIPANTQARIRSTTIFGAKYVDLIYPEQPSAQHISAGAVIQSLNVSTEVNTVFQSLVSVLNKIDPPKLNAVLSAIADSVRGRGQRIGEATTATDHLLAQINPRMGTVRQDWRSIAGVADAYSAAAPDLIAAVKAFSTTSATITSHASDLDALLLNSIGFAQAGIDLLAPSYPDLVKAINVLEPTADLLMKYNPEYTCSLVGAKSWLDQDGYQVLGGNGYSAILDSTFLFSGQPYRYPDNLPIVAAKGGPGGKPGCGSLPDVTQNYPVRQLVTDTGWGTGLDIRPNPGVQTNPWWVDFFPVTRGIPQPPMIHGDGPPAIGPVPYPGAPPYGAPIYGPDGAPLYPPPPGPPGTPTP
jgi:phospholipid/cholesterol/gamma-HCH transport system substrate-binding protein